MLKQTVKRVQQELYTEPPPFVINTLMRGLYYGEWINLSPPNPPKWEIRRRPSKSSYADAV